MAAKTCWFWATTSSISCGFSAVILNGALPMFATMASPFVNAGPRRDAPGSRQRNADLIRWATKAAQAADLRTTAMVGAEHGPDHYVASSQLKIVLGLGLYVAEPDAQPKRITTSSTLRSWAERDVAETAFEHLYADSSLPASDSAPEGDPADQLGSSMLLNPAQRHVIAASTRQRLTVVSGPPGTGKSQTVVAAALHHVGLGRSVLVAAPTDAAVGALVALLNAAPGPDPVVFGASMKRLDVANRLADGGGPWFDDAAVARTRAAAESSSEDAERRRDQIAGLLAAEAGANIDPNAVLIARQEAPGLFDVDVDLFAMRVLVERAEPTGGWFGRRRSRRAFQQLQQQARCERSLELPHVARLVQAAITRRRAADLESVGGLDLGQSWENLGEAEDRARRLAGEALQAATHHDDRADRSSRRAIGSVASALRSGRATRRQTLAHVSGRELTAALPLWIATMRDIDDLLPMQSNMFDMVIIDEASHIDQIGAAPTLLRARDALVVGDPRQLRHVSFLSEARISESLNDNELSGTTTASQLDLRRQTLFDAAAAVAPVVVLDEHYRSAPHLIDFSARRFYDGRLHVATRHPRNETDDRIDVIAAGGHRDGDGVNHDEVALIVECLRVELRQGATSVGVLSPFRAQADALEAAVIAAFELSEIDALDLRIGTVHSFQGCQRDVVYISLAIDDDAPRGSMSFLAEATLFNVMVTRAKKKIHVVSSLTPPDAGLLADYLRHAAAPMSARPRSTALGRWPARVRDELEHAGLHPVAGYPTGRHQVDVVVGAHTDAVALICGVHPDGAQAHIDRHLDLVRNGWTVREVFESRWGDRLAELSIDLAPI